MINKEIENVQQKLTEVESESLFVLLEILERQGWSYGANTQLMRGVFIGPDNQFDLWPSMRTGDHELQWSLHYPSTTGHADKPPRGMHTLLWRYSSGASDEESANNFIAAALASIAEITALPRL